MDKQVPSLTAPVQGYRDSFKVNNACGKSCCGRATLWQLYSVMRGTVPALFALQPSCSLTQLRTCSPSVVLFLFLLMNATVPGLVSSEASTELLLITLSSSFFPVTSTAAAAAAAATATSSSSSSSWSEYWLKASTSSLKISSLMNPPSGRGLTEHKHRQSVKYLFFTGFQKC